MASGYRRKGPSRVGAGLTNGEWKPVKTQTLP